MADVAELTGCQFPTYMTVPPYAATTGGEAADLAAMYGTPLDDWQRLCLDGGMGEKPDGSWSAFEVAMILARQNGKNVVFEAREMTGLFLLNEKLILHTAHQYKTAQESFRRVVEIVSNYDWFQRKVKRVVRTNGEEAVELKSGARLRFLARSLASGRGFSGNCIVLDESYELGDDEMSALLPTLSAQRNTQVWYGSSAGLQRSVQLARVWRRIRKAVVSGVPDRSLAGYEWAADLCTLFCRPGCDRHDRHDDPAVWAKTNPALGIPHLNGTMLTVSAIENELATLGREAFVRERLSVGDYPSEDEGAWSVIPEDIWASRKTGFPGAMVNPLAFAVDASPGQEYATIAVASWHKEGILVEVPEWDHRPGIGWVEDRIKELVRRHRPRAGIVIDPRGPASGLIKPLESGRIEITKPALSDSAQGFAQFTTGVLETGDLRHLGQPELAAALKGATVRETGDGGKLWARRDTTVDISPLVAVTLAQWALRKYGASYDLLKSVASPT